MTIEKKRHLESYHCGPIVWAEDVEEVRSMSIVIVATVVAIFCLGLLAGVAANEVATN
jgi:preprotein translocase subunit SecE